MLRARLLQSHPQRVALPRLFSSIREGGTIAMQDMSIADRREREAVQRGALERLRGHGMPLPDEGESVVHLNLKGNLEGRAEYEMRRVRRQHGAPICPARPALLALLASLRAWHSSHRRVCAPPPRRSRAAIWTT